MSGRIRGDVSYPFVKLPWVACTNVQPGVTRVPMAVEQRKSRRRSVHADGFLYATDGLAIGPCRVDDVSVGGAKLSHAIGEEIPSQLVLSFSRNGQVRRRCQVVWRSQHAAGVRFIEGSPAEKPGG